METELNIETVFPIYKTLPEFSKQKMIWKLPPEERNKRMFKSNIMFHGLRLLEKTGLPKHYWLAAPKEYQSLFLFGTAGVGKTYTAAQMLKWLVIEQLRTYSVDVEEVAVKNIVFVVTEQFIKQCRQISISNETLTEAAFHTRYYDADYLFLDDFGTTKPTEFVKSELFELINYRYNNNLPLFISSNDALEQIAFHYGDKIASRLSGMCTPILLEGRDLRIGPK